MTETAVSCSLRDAVDEVLETMFFVQSEGPATQERPPEELVCAEVSFEGSPSGTLRLGISLQAARTMAADFLGEEVSELLPARIPEVISELANMICGSYLSRVESETTFRLSPPMPTFDVGQVGPPSDGYAYHVKLPDGALSVMLVAGEPGS
jgi:CheY-specific phosphatase CheX